jgi:UDP-N-acetylmuramate dehydrogenase
MPIRSQQNIALADYTSLAVGGNAAFFAPVTSESQVIEALWWAQRQRLAIRLLGGGTNVLVGDDGVDGLVLQPALRGRAVIDEDEAAVWVEVGAGEPWDDLVAWSVSEGLCGIEALSGIPGWCGAAPIQNIGAYGQELATVIEAVRGVDRDRGRAVWMAAAELGFSYRSSYFKTLWRDRFVITALRLRLRKGKPAAARYPQLADALAGTPDHPEQVRAAVLSLRAAKSMLYDRSDPNHRSAGSFFLNPVLSATELAMLRARLGAAGVAPDTLPSWEQAGGAKVSAAWLIDRAGLKKGFVMGAAGLSTNHCLALINRGGATARELLALAAYIRAEVGNRFGVSLQPEPAIWA